MCEAKAKKQKCFRIVSKQITYCDGFQRVKKSHHCCAIVGLLISSIVGWEGDRHIPGHQAVGLRVCGPGQTCGCSIFEESHKEARLSRMFDILWTK